MERWGKVTRKDWEGSKQNVRQQSEVEVMVAPGQPDVQPQY